MAQNFPFDKTVLRARLKALGLTDVQLEEITAVFDQKSRHLDVITFVLIVERFGIPRESVYAFLKQVGMDDATLINVFSRADLKKAGLDETKLQEVVLTE